MNFKYQLLTFFAILCFGSANSQAYQSYVLDSTIAYKWELFEPAAPAEIITLSGEDEVYAVTLPFPFRYFDSTYSAAFVSINGNVTFGRNYSQSDFNREHLCNPVSQLYNPAGNQDALNPDNFIAVFWDDLFLDPACKPVGGGTAKLAYRTIGTAPNREFIIVWDYFVRSGDLAPCATVAPDYSSQLNVELRLFERTNVIEVHLKNNQLTGVQQATIAVENAAGDYAEYAHCSAANPPGPGPKGYRFTPSLNPPLAVPTAGYCAANGESCALPALRWINKVTLSNLVNPSQCSASGYSDFTSVGAAKLDSGVSYQLTVNVKTFTNAGYTCRAWIDWDRDTTFNGANELYQLAGTSSGAATGDGIYTGVITVPAGTDTGLVRMRIRHVFATGNLEPCGADAIGEVEDYHISVGIPLTGYCSAEGGDCDTAYAQASPNFDHITSVTIQTDATNIVNPSGCNSGYGDFTGDNTLWVNWSGGNQYTVVLKRKVPGYVFGKAKAFVDWNQDFDFDDAGEAFVGVANIVDSTSTFVINSPSGIPIGFTRMRLRTTSSQTSTGEPCGVQKLGEVEDYTVVITDPNITPPACVSNTSPADGATNLCQTQKLIWNKVTDADGYTLNLWQENPMVVLVSDLNKIDPDTSYVISSPLDVGKTYVWTIVPYNADGDAFNCDTLRFTISPDLDPTAMILPNFDTIFQCTSTALQLDGNPQQGTQPYSHSWNGSNNSLLSDTAIANPIFAGASSGNYKYKYIVSDNKGCQGKDSVVISIIPAVASGNLVADDNSLCDGGSTVFTHSGFVGNVTIQDSTAGMPWTDVVLSQPAVNRYSTGSLNETTYYRAIASAGSCADTSAALTITVNPIPADPIVVANGPTTFCFGDSVGLIVTNYSTGLVWNDPNRTTGPNLVVKMARSYAVNYTDGNGCSSVSPSITINVNASPNKPQIQILGNPNTCLGDTLVLFVNNPNNDNLLWNDGAATANDSLVVFTAGNYQVTASKFGCSTKSDVLTLLFNFKPAKPIISQVGPSQPCEGDQVQLVSSYSSGISWNNSSTNDTILVTSNGTFNVTYTDGSGCSSTSDNYSVNFAATPATPTVIQVGDSLMSSVSGFVYQWIGPLGPINGANRRFYKPTISGNYRVVVYTQEGCGSAQSSPYFFSGTGISESILQGITVYPNPVNQTLTIDNVYGDNLEVVLYNTIGKEILRTKTTGSSTSIDLSELAAGAYLLKFSSDKGQLMKTIIKN